eukprot:1139547-Pelagomonas_calceolata.AAC.13
MRRWPSASSQAVGWAHLHEVAGGGGSKKGSVPTYHGNRPTASSQAADWTHLYKGAGVGGCRL